jgi:hypothetical protein
MWLYDAVKKMTYDDRLYLLPAYDASSILRQSNKPDFAPQSLKTWKIQNRNFDLNVWKRFIFVHNWCRFSKPVLLWRKMSFVP